MEFALVISAAALLGFLFQKLKQPVLLAFIVTGILLGSSFLNVIVYTDLLQIFSDFGIAFLLFLVGINLDLRIIKEIGKTSAITGLGQILFTSIIGFFIAQLLGFDFIESLYIAIALTFSSTIIIVKLLSDKKELNSLYGKISVGFLIVQDFAAIAILVFISVFSFSAEPINQVFWFIINMGILLGLFFVFYKFLIKKIFDSIAHNQELLFLTSIAWCFVFASIAIFMGFSKEIGAFLAGVSIAALPYTYEIFGKLKYLRDFFIVLFFVVLGSNLVFTAGHIVFFPALVFSLFVLIGNPLIVFILMAKIGYKGRTSFLSSLTVAQISEFSLIIIFLGQKVGQVSNEIVSIITLVAVVTISASTYLIIYNNKIYDFLANAFPLLKNKRFSENSLHNDEEKKYSLVCIGYGETAKRIFYKNKEKKENILIVDFDPRSLNEAQKNGFETIYGDANDLETIEKIIAVKPETVVSTTMESESNILLTKKLSEKKEIIFIALAHSKKDALKMEKAGIQYVLVPSITAAKKIKTLLEDIEKGRTLELMWLKEHEFNY
ncbi:MAG: cation:proton antiporter [Candidatus Diapherotrites archaeon]|nr:cation:proton antiporter [Candidatus Diapherotrites archaeon]